MGLSAPAQTRKSTLAHLSPEAAAADVAVEVTVHGRMRRGEGTELEDRASLRRGGHVDWDTELVTKPGSAALFAVLAKAAAGARSFHCGGLAEINATAVVHLFGTDDQCARLEERQRDVEVAWARGETVA